ncbi:tail tape measure protein [Novosphingobium sp.]|uniref:tail tape measure protein n=1 Tax=Novosphingobium sp. TaxID=1874826 RepID=UPI001DFF02FF|nr:tail tape measure protein [Novosphingobium sp.]MBX9664802.1 tail tape measure protein [Novosphingobium sp.]
MDSLSTLVVDVRASTEGFAADVGQMRSSFDSIVVDGFSRGSDVLERGLLSAVRRGSLGFEDLRRAGLRVLDDIAAQAIRGGLASIGLGGSGGSGLGGGILGIGSLISSIFGLPGRATGGPVAPGRPYLVGERGPELFVPTSAGQIDPGTGGGARAVNVSIKVVAPEGSSSPESLRRSSRQVAQAVRRALSEY